MSRYRKIEVRTWSDEKFRALSGIPPSGQGLWFFLLTGPHTTAIPGLFRAGRAGMAEELGWSGEAFDEAFREVFDQGMAKADFKAKLVWLPKAIQHNKPESPNVVRGWRVELDLLPECDLKREALAAIREALAMVGPSYVEAFDELFSKGGPAFCRKPEATAEKTQQKASAKALPKTSPNQEQEQEQEQEQDKEDGKNGDAVLPCPQQEIIELYHRLLPTGRQVREWTDARQTALRARWREKPARQKLAWWERFFAYCAESDFLTGKTHTPGRKPFELSLDWLVKSENMAKVIEGAYQNEKEAA